MVLEPNNKGDRVRKDLTGKFLRYKHHGNEEVVSDPCFEEGRKHGSTGGNFPPISPRWR